MVELAVEQVAELAHHCAGRGGAGRGGAGREVGARGAGVQVAGRVSREDKKKRKKERKKEDARSREDVSLYPEHSRWAGATHCNPMWCSSRLLRPQLSAPFANRHSLQSKAAFQP